MLWLNLRGADYEYGWSGVPQDYAEAIRWYTKAADLGKTPAMYQIGCSMSTAMAYHGTMPRHVFG
jgi:TPR repeat protein